MLSFFVTQSSSRNHINLQAMTWYIVLSRGKKICGIPGVADGDGVLGGREEPRSAALVGIGLHLGFGPK